MPADQPVLYLLPYILATSFVKETLQRLSNFPDRHYYPFKLRIYSFPGIGFEYFKEGESDD